MSSIESSNQSLNNILDKIGVRTPEGVPAKRKNSLGQEDFLKLMTTQLQNQDPFAPMENGDFIAQMAQFSTVTGITEMSNNMKALNDKIDSFRIATASQYLDDLSSDKSKLFERIYIKFSFIVWSWLNLTSRTLCSVFLGESI